MRGRLVGPAHPDYAESLNHLAKLLAERASYDSAELLYGDALAIRLDRLGPAAPQVAETLSDLASLHAMRGRYGAADSLFREALTIRTSNQDVLSPEVTRTLKDLGWVYHRAGDYGRVAKDLESSAAEFLARIPIEPGTHVLDVACGTGQIAFATASVGALVTGIDIAPNLIQQARARAKAQGMQRRTRTLCAMGDCLPQAVSMFPMRIAWGE